MSVAPLPVGTGLPIKPRLRGHLHQWAAATFFVAGIVLIALADGSRARFAAIVYAIAVCLLYGTSALYHRRTWQPKAKAIMRRLDHSMILVLIAGTYTPFALLLLHGGTSTAVLALAWGGALAGITMRMLWLSAPRWAVIPPYLLVGWIAVFVMPELLHAGGVATLVLVAGGGLIYSLGAVVYATKRPDPWPKTFGYHEVFHLMTILAGVMMYIAISFAVYS
ncbi:MAG TPA: hemolysin III family protein [Frankiaceae bacterium]|nr:hemolysin III family protein [Frankiaceae bacterium]